MYFNLKWRNLLLHWRKFIKFCPNSKMIILCKSLSTHQIQPFSYQIEHIRLMAARWQIDGSSTADRRLIKHDVEDRRRWLFMVVYASFCVCVCVFWWFCVCLSGFFVLLMREKMSWDEIMFTFLPLLCNCVDDQSHWMKVEWRVRIRWFVL